MRRADGITCQACGRENPHIVEKGTVAAKRRARVEVKDDGSIVVKSGFDIEADDFHDHTFDHDIWACDHCDAEAVDPIDLVEFRMEPEPGDRFITKDGRTITAVAIEPTGMHPASCNGDRWWVIAQHEHWLLSDLTAWEPNPDQLTMAVAA